MKITTARLLQTLPVLALTCGLAWVTPAQAQDGADLPARHWQTVRRGELIAGGGDQPWQNVTDTAVHFTLTPDPQDVNADLLIVRPLATAVGATGRGDAAVGFGPEAVSVFRINRSTGVIARVDGRDAAALDAVNASAARGSEPEAAVASADDESDNAHPAATRQVRVPLTSLGTDLTGLGDADLEIVSTPIVVNGQTVAHLQQYSAAPLSFTTAQGDTVLLRAGGYTALDPSGAVVLASGQSTAGQVVTTDGSLQPFTTQQSSRAGAADGGPDPLSPAARAALNALLPTPAPLTDAGFSQAAPADGTASTRPIAAPAWAGAVTTVAAGIDALAGAAGNAFGDAPDPFAAARAASGLAAAAVGDQINALALTGTAVDAPDTAAAYRGLAQRAGGGAGTGLLAQTPGGSVQPAADADPSPLTGALAAVLNPSGAPSTSALAPENPLAPAPAPAENPLAPSGEAGPGTAAATAAANDPGLAALNALSAPRAPRGGASGADALRSALGGAPAGGVGGVATALGGGAVYGINPVSGAAGALPNLATQVFVNDTGGQRTAVANAAGTTVVPASFLNFNPGVLPGSSGGFSSITVPNGLFTFSVFDSGGADNEDVQNITLTNNGSPVALTSAAGSDGTGTTLFFLSNGQGTTFNAGTNPAVDANRFSATVSPGTAILSLEGVSSTFGPNTGAFVVTSPVITGTNQQVFDLRQTPSVPPSDDLDFARLGILVQN